MHDDVEIELMPGCLQKPSGRPGGPLTQNQKSDRESKNAVASPLLAARLGTPDHVPRFMPQRAHGVVVSHPLSMRAALGSIPSVSKFGLGTPVAFCKSHTCWRSARLLMTAVGFEPTPLRTGAWSQRLRPLGQTVLMQGVVHVCGAAGFVPVGVGAACTPHGPTRA